MKNWFSKLVVVIKAIIAAFTKPTPITPTTDPTTNPTTGPLVDPPAPYDQTWMDAHGESEECGVERELGIICRPMFWRGGHGGWWTISSLAMKHILRDVSGIRCDDWTENGYAFHVRGSCGNEPQGGDPSPKLDVVGNRNLNKYVFIEIRLVA